MNGSNDGDSLEAVVGQLIGGLEFGEQRLDGPYRARLFEANGSIQTTIPKAARDRFDTDLDELGDRSHYVAKDHGLLIIDLEGDFQR